MDLFISQDRRNYTILSVSEECHTDRRKSGFSNLFFCMKVMKKEIEKKK